MIEGVRNHRPSKNDQKMSWNDLKNSTKRILYIRCFSASLKFVSAFRLLIVYLQTKEGKTTLALTVLNFSFSFRLTTALGMKSLCPLISKWPLFVYGWHLLQVCHEDLQCHLKRKTTWSLPEDGGERINLSNSNLYTHCSAGHVITEMLLCYVKPRWVGSDDHADGGSGHHGGGPGAHQGERNQHQTAGGDPRLALWSTSSTLPSALS